MKLYPSHFYHIYNHANGSENLFYETANYKRFLEGLQVYIMPYAEIHAYCLMPNHFHLLIRVHNPSELNLALIEKQSVMDLIGMEFPKKDRLKTFILNPEQIVSKQFSDFFNAYSQYLNRRQERKGNLFRRGFKSKVVDDSNYLKHLLRYIHKNPVNHKYTTSLVDWPWTSYFSYLNTLRLKRGNLPLLELFEDDLDFYLWHLG